MSEKRLAIADCLGALAKVGTMIMSLVLDREDDGSVEIGPREGFGGPAPPCCLQLSEVEAGALIVSALGF